MDGNEGYWEWYRLDGTLDLCQKRIIQILGTGVPDGMRNSVQAERLTLSRQQWFTI